MMGNQEIRKKPFKMGMKIDLINGVASIVNENHPGEAGRWLDARKVNLNVTSLKVEGADVFADIRNFNFITKRYGKEHIVDTFSTNFELTKTFEVGKSDFQYGSFSITGRSYS
jgi:hypothetical protein